MLKSMGENQKLLQDISEDADRHIIRARVDNIEITIPGFLKSSKLIMNLGGVVVEEVLESGIAGISDFIEKEAAFEEKIGEIKRASVKA